MKKTSLQSISLLAILVSVPGHAQTAVPDEGDGPRSPIVVTGRGLDLPPGDPAYGTVELDRDTVLQSASGRIEDVLSGVAGFAQFRRSDSRAANPSAQGATLRGLGGNATSRSLVLLDGVPQANPFFGYIPFSALPPERIGLIRVTRGGGSGAFGAGAVAGTIAMESAGLNDHGLIEGSAFVNDRGETELSASAAPRLGAGFVTVSGRWDRGKGFYTTPRDQRVPASARAEYDSRSMAIRGVAPIGSAELQMRMAAFDDDRTLRFDGADSSSSGQDFSLRLVGGHDWKFDVLGYVQARDFSNVVISSSRFTRVLDQSSTPSTGWGGKVEIRPPVGSAHVLRLGADLRVTDGELREQAYNAVSGALTARRKAGGRNTDFGLYAEDDWQIGALTLTGGVRLDRWVIEDGFYNERDGDNILAVDDRFARRSGWDESVRAGMLYDLGGGVRMRAAGYTGLRLPTLNELYRPFVVFPVTTRANEKLENEKLRGFEAGLEYAGQGFDVSVTAFHNRLRNAVTNVTIGEDLRQRRNIDAIVAKGIELDAGLNFGPAALALSATWTDAENDASGDALVLDGLRPAQVPKFAVSATASVRPADGYHLAATLRHEGKRYENDLNTDVLPAATTLDAYASIALRDGLNVVLRGENLFDENIVTRNQGGSIDIGTPRTVWFGIRASLGR